VLGGGLDFDIGDVVWWEEGGFGWYCAERGGGLSSVFAIGVVVEGKWARRGWRVQLMESGTWDRFGVRFGLLVTAIWCKEGLCTSAATVDCRLEKTLKAATVDCRLEKTLQKQVEGLQWH